MFQFFQMLLGYNFPRTGNECSKNYFWHKNEKKISLNLIFVFEPLRFRHTCHPLSEFAWRIKLIQSVVGSVASHWTPGSHYQVPGCQDPMSQGHKSQGSGSQFQSPRILSLRVPGSRVPEPQVSGSRVSGSRVPGLRSWF